jgi:hypothetical protein
MLALIRKAGFALEWRFIHKTTLEGMKFRSARQSLLADGVSCGDAVHEDQIPFFR